jgi:hypothetical protein
MPIYKHIPTYMEQLLPRRYNYGIKVANGWVWGKTNEYEDIPNIIMSRYDQITANSLAATMDNTATAIPQGYTQWKALTENEDYFYEYESDKILQAFIGIHPSPARLFRRIPSPLPRGNLSRIKVPGVPVNTSIGFVDGKQAGSPFDVPTVLTEMLLPRYTIVDFAVFNPLAVPITPIFNIVIRRHKVKWYNPEKKEDKDKIMEMWTGKRPWKPWSPGIDPMIYDAEGNLNVKPIDLDTLEG